MKKIGIVLLSLVILALGWYLFVKKFDYQISFKTKYGPSAIYYDFYDAQEINRDTLLSSIKYSQLEQRSILGDTTFLFEWNFEKNTDSTTQVTVNIKESSHPFAARLNVLNPFNSDYVTQLKSYFKEYNWLMDEKQKKYRIDQELQETIFTGKTCVCTFSEAKINFKAHNMLDQLSILDYFFYENNVKPTGDPLLIMEKWDHDEEHIKFKFCFPLKMSDSLALTRNTTFENIPDFEAYGATYNGNYKFSHRQWAEMQSQIKQKGEKVSDTIIEVYHNSPLVDTNAENWSATVYIPKN